MNPKRVVITSAIFVIGIAIGFAVGSARTNHMQKRDSAGRLLGSYFNSSRAREMKPEMALSQVIETLGDPIGQWDGWLEFVPSPEGRMIRVKVGETGLVKEIDPGVD
jgi:hypothetical protein